MEKEILMIDEYCRHDLHDGFCDDFSKALLDFVGEQTFGGAPISKCKLQSPMITLQNVNHGD